MSPKTPTQLEDAAIADVIRSVVSIKTRQIQREMQNAISEKVMPQLESARLKGKKVDIHRLVQEVARETASN